MCDRQEEADSEIRNIRSFQPTEAEHQCLPLHLRNKKLPSRLFSDHPTFANPPPFPERLGEIVVEARQAACNFPIARSRNSQLICAAAVEKRTHPATWSLCYIPNFQPLAAHNNLAVETQNSCPKVEPASDAHALANANKIIRAHFGGEHVCEQGQTVCAQAQGSAPPREGRAQAHCPRDGRLHELRERPYPLRRVTWQNPEENPFLLARVFLCHPGTRGVGQN